MRRELDHNMADLNREETLPLRVHQQAIDNKRGKKTARPDERMKIKMILTRLEKQDEINKIT